MAVESAGKGNTVSQAIGVCVVVALGLALRVPFLSRGWSSDEVAQVAFGALEPLRTAETRVNPPLLRSVLVGAFGEIDALTAGRFLSFACGLLAIVAAFYLGRRLAGPVAGLLVALLVALHPDAAEHAALFRAYSPWLLVGLLHAWAIVAHLDGERAAAPVLAVTALLMPWLHYLSLPLLAAETLALGWMGPRRTLWWLAPAWLGVVLLGVVWTLAVPGGYGRGNTEPLVEFVVRLLSLGVSGVHLVIVPIVLLAALVGWRPVGAVGVLLVTGLAYLVCCAVLASFVDVRPPALILLLPYLVPVYASAEASLQTRYRWAFPIAALATVSLFGSLALVQVAIPQDRDGIDAFVAARPRFPELWSGTPVVVSPSHVETVLAIVVAEQPIHRLDTSCDERVPLTWRDRLPLGCLEADGALFVGADQPLDGATDVVVFGPNAALPPGCAVRAAEAGFVVGRCPAP